MPPDDPTDADAARLYRHDLKGGLTSIRGQAQLLLRFVGRADGLDPAHRARLEEGLGRIVAAADGMNGRIDREAAPGREG